MARIQSRRSLQRGFSLIELIIVIIITGILAGILFVIIRGPLQAYVQVERRAVLVDIVETALQRMTREIRLALPYSVRVDNPGGVEAVEFIRTLDGGRYRNRGANRLKFNQSSGSFDVLNTLVNFSSIDFAAPASSQDCINGLADCLVVYNIGQPTNSATATAIGFSANAYLGASNAYEGNIAAITAAGANSLTFDNSDLTWSFGRQSPMQRFQIADTPVSFVCNGSEIYRYSDYPLTESQQANPGGSSSLLIDQVTGCEFDYQEPTLSRFGLLTLRIVITDAASGESASLLQQIHTTNVP
jgi:MSHA biogenesis protein MshO